MAREVKIRITGESSGLKSAFADAENDAKGFGSRLGSILGTAAKGGALAFAGGLAAAAPLLKSSIDAASDFGETVSKSKVIFGDAQEEVAAFAKTAAKSFGQSEQQALDAASTFAVFGKSAGLTGTDLAKFSTKLTGLASDMASFSNSSPEEAIEAIGAALRGEAEPIRRYGVLLDDATLRNQALKMGLISSTKEALTPANKALAAQAAILEQTADAQGDFARTSEGLANKQRTLAAQFADAKVQLGEALLPAMLAVTDFALNRALPAFERLAGWVRGFADTVRESGWSAALQELLGGVGEWVNTTALPWLGERAKEMGGKIAELAKYAWDFLKANLPTWLQAFGQWFTETAVPWVVEKVEAVASAVAGWVPQAWEKTVEKLKDYLQKLEAWFENDGKAGGEAGGQSVTEGVIRGLGKLWLSTQTVLAEWQAKVAHWFFTEGAPAFAKGMGELWAAAMQTFAAATENLVRASFRIGQDIVAGFIDGILNLADELQATITRFIWAPVKEARKLLGISSPSKVFAIIGGQIAQGLAVGLDAGGTQVAAASQRLAETSMVGFGGVGLAVPAPAGAFARGPATGVTAPVGFQTVRGLGDGPGGELALSASSFGGSGGNLDLTINGVIGDQHEVARVVVEALRRYGYAVGA